MLKNSLRRYLTSRLISRSDLIVAPIKVNSCD